MSDGANFHPHVVLKQKAEEFKTMFDGGIHACLYTLDSKIAELSSPQVLSVPANELAVVFSRVKSDIFRHMENMTAELSKLWVESLSEMKDTFIKDVEIFLAATKLVTATYLEDPALVNESSSSENISEENIAAESMSEENIAAESMSEENIAVKSISEGNIAAENICTENIEISLCEAIVGSPSPKYFKVSSKTPEVVILTSMKKRKRSPSPVNMFAENIEISLCETVGDPCPETYEEDIGTQEVMCGPMQVASLEEFLSILREYEIQTCTKFVCISSDKSFTDIDFTPTKNLKVHWSNGTPQFYIGRRTYACHLGKDTNTSNKKKYAVKRDSRADKDLFFTDRRKLVLPTKKLGCPVVIKVARVLNLPRFKIEVTESKWKRVKVSELIKRTLASGEDLGGENAYCFELPPEDSHQNHTVTVKENIDHKVRSKIKELVTQGHTRVSNISLLVEQFVANELGETDRDRTRFHPSKRCVKSIVKSAKREIRMGSMNLKTEIGFEEESS